MSTSPLDSVIVLEDDRATLVESLLPTVVTLDGTNPLQIVEVQGPTVTEIIQVLESEITVLTVAEQGPAGSAAARMVSAVCDASLAKGTPLYINRLTGHLDKADASSKSTGYVAGLAAAPTLPGFVASAFVDSLTLTDWSAITAYPALAPGQPYFLAAGGGLTTIPASPPSVNTLVGVADDAFTLTLKLSTPIQL
jgi:hypothetical protein